MSPATRDDVALWGCIVATVASRSNIAAALFGFLAAFIYLCQRREGANP